MKLVDANVLLYAVNKSAPHHEVARTWLDDALDGEETIAFCWVVMLAFLRISTRPGIFATPLSANEAADVLDAWLSQPNAVVVEPTMRHFLLLRGMLRSVGTAGNLVSDAHLAVIAIEHSAEVVTFDADLSRFDVTVVRPGR
jgi:toxin-antitoxin system PIN domain toxin